MLILGNGRVITRDVKNPYLENGAVAIDGATIKKVGSLDDVRAAYPRAEFMDVKGKLIMPAFINTHEHIYSAFARGLSIKGYSPDGFLEILDGQWWTIDRNLTLEDTYLSAMATYIDCIKNGVTTIFDHHASFGAIRDSLFHIEKAAKETGVRSCLCYEVSDRDGKEKAKDSVIENAEFIKHALKDNTGMIAGMMGMHAQFTISDETMELAAANKPDGVGYHIHVAEGIEDLHHCLKHYGKRIVDRLYDWDILGEKTLLGHCIYVNKHEMDLIKDTNTMVVHNPESNMGNACGCPPTMELVHKGILTGLGTDGYTHDMIESWKVANILHKHHLCDAGAAWAEVPQMLFEGNPQIANRYFEQKLGVLEEGAAADVIVMNYDPLTPFGADNCNGHILFGMNGRDVVTTVANGKILMKDRELQHIDEAKVMADCRQAAGALAKRING
ncbi:putative aminohydrolase SsnA [Muricomes intestini]|jgi:putative selenium metabolism protein SsnA|uniref:Putative selenium metabolism protein SsnA n=1 Tax=Muricomes intestini TaxID=1796634 RepID=A0A4V2US61_9FIRM|nr:putative aminohydrolase SsnA [Muricomes intestini]TCS80222.1 putative selenium metabolism protein SsnA [Muricomes intestini]HAX52408.1 putative aminohydrolase SsnA [Lachnospiraceae bacterium]